MGVTKMGLRIKKYKDSYRPWWYATYKHNGQGKEIRLDVAIAGVPPASLSVKDTGSILFEKSRIKAQDRLDGILREIRQKSASEAIMEELIEAKTGEKVEYVRLDELASKWNGIARTQPLSDGRVHSNAHTFAEFEASCNHKYLYEVTTTDVARYFNWCRAKYAWATVKGKMSLLSGAFARFLPVGRTNPFKSIMKRDSSPEAATIHHRPLTDSELFRVREIAKKDDFLYPLVECAICTGMRLKDICFLRWVDIDLKAGFVSYSATKTHSRCECPIFPEFQSVLEGILATKNPTETLVFPEAAHMYQYNRSGLVHLGKKLLASAIFGDVQPEMNITEVVDGKPINQRTPIEMLGFIDTLPITTEKAHRLKDIYSRYVVQQQSYRDIEKETGISRSSISDSLKDLEKHSGERIIRFDPTQLAMRDRIKMTREQRGAGKRAVCLYGWHSFRATFCVLALNSGVPDSIVMKIVGHTTFRTTSEFYNNPTKSQMREMITSKMSRTAIGSVNSDTPKPSDLKSLVDALSPKQRSALLSELTSQLLSA